MLIAIFVDVGNEFTWLWKKEQKEMHEYMST